MSMDFAPICVAPSLTVKEAMRRLEETERRILFVVDPDQTLRGSLVDGDIRRWILAEGPFDAPVEKVCNAAPFSVGDGYDPAALRQTALQRRITCVPVVNSRGQIVEVLFWEDLFGEPAEDRSSALRGVPVVIMAGGQGTRLDPFTQVLPKPLIPIGKKTIIELIIDSFIRHGVDAFHISVNYKARILKSYFEELNPPYSISYIEEAKPLGTAGALRSLFGQIHTPLFVTNCDIIVKAEYGEILEFHNRSVNDVTLVASLKNFRIPYGVVDIQTGGTLRQITEKPEYSFLVNTGMYVVTPDVLQHITIDEACDFPQLIERVAAHGGKVGVFPVSEGAWLDIGEWAEYKNTLERFRL